MLKKRNSSSKTTRVVEHVEDLWLSQQFNMGIVLGRQFAVNLKWHLSYLQIAVLSIRPVIFKHMCTWPKNHDEEWE